MAQLATMQIDTDNQGEPYIELADVNGGRFRVEVTDEMLYTLARDLPGYANALARARVMKDPRNDPDLRINTDAVDAAGIEVNQDILGERVLLSVEDPRGVRSVWRLTPQLAQAVGGDLQARGRNLSNKTGAKN